MNVVNLKINLNGNAQKGIVDIDSAMSNLSNTTQKTRSMFERLAVGAFGVNNILQTVRGVVNTVSSAIAGLEQAYNIQAQAETKLATVMRQRTGATDEQIESIKALARAQQEIGVIGDEVQLSGAQQVATFVTQKESLDALIPAMNNLLAQQKGLNATSEDAVGIGNLMGKVLQGQTSALTRVGITFTEAEEQVLKYGTEQQRAAMLAQVITNNVGEMNAALAATPEGQLKQHANTMGDIDERLGGLVVRVKSAFMPALNTVAQNLQVFVVWLENNSAAITSFVTTAANVVGVAFGAIGSVIKVLISAFMTVATTIDTLSPIVAGLAVLVGGLTLALNAGSIAAYAKGAAMVALAGYQSVATFATQGLTVATSLLNAIMALNPYAMVAIAIAAVTAAIVVCWNKFEGFRVFILTLWDTIKGFGDVLKEYVIDRVTTLISGLGNIGSAISKLFNGDFAGAASDAKRGVLEISGYESFKRAATQSVELFGAWGDNFTKNLTAEQEKSAAQDEAQQAGENLAQGISLAGLPAVASSSPMADVNTTASNTTSGGDTARVKNINITIDKVVESFTISTTNIKEDLSKVKQLVADALLDAINDINYV